MKNKILPFLLALGGLTGCSPNDVNDIQNMNSTEQLLVGQWKLKRSEWRPGYNYMTLGDSLECFNRYFNYSNARLDLSSTSDGLEYVIDYYGWNDFSSPDVGDSWYVDENINSIFIRHDAYIIKYLSTDSLILEYNGGDRFFYSKNSIQPTLTNIETLLLGTWLWTNNPLSSVQQYFNFTDFRDVSTSGSCLTYYATDSVTYSGGYSSDSFEYKVLFPERPVPILNYLLGGPCKITNLTANSLTLEHYDDYFQSTDILYFEKQ